MATEDLERAIEWSSGHPRLWMALSAFQGLPCREIAELTTEQFNSMSAPTTLQLSGKASTTWRSSQLHQTVIAAINAAKLPSRGLLFPVAFALLTSERAVLVCSRLKARPEPDFVTI